MCKVSIIIPTTCTKLREDCLQRAISSVANQNDVNVEIVVIVNGEQFDPELFGTLKADRKLSVFYLKEGNVSKSRYMGINKSQYDCFGFLDDDDELLPNTLRQRFDILDANDQACVAISNGYFFNGTDYINVDEQLCEKIHASPISSFLEYNWFASPAALYNKNYIDTEIFNIDYKYFEMSYIFLKLVEKHYKLIFVNKPTYRCYADTNVSASKSENYQLFYPDMLKVMLSMNLSSSIKRALKIKYVRALNSLSNYFLEKGNKKKALYFHLKCLLNGGLGYVFYTREFFR